MRLVIAEDLSWTMTLALLEFAVMQFECVHPIAMTAQTIRPLLGQRERVLILSAVSVTPHHPCSSVVIASATFQLDAELAGASATTEFKWDHSVSCLTVEAVSLRLFSRLPVPIKST